MKRGDPYSRAWGLTGIIGSGKSTAARLFQEQGAAVIDADQLAREVIEPASISYPKIRKMLEQAFPGEVLFQEDGRLDRARLAALGFSRRDTTELLNRAFHPAVETLFADKVKSIPPETLLIYDVPLLFENHLERRLKGSIVVWCDEETALRRAMERSSLTLEQVRARLAQQISINEKRKLADYILDNSGSLAELSLQVKNLYRLLTGR